MFLPQIAQTKQKRQKATEIEFEYFTLQLISKLPLSNINSNI